jgi:hypothetical protein
MYANMASIWQKWIINDPGLSGNHIAWQTSLANSLNSFILTSVVDRYRADRPDGKNDLSGQF